MLEVVICVKAVPDPKEDRNTKFNPVTKTLARGDIPLVVNPLDRNALEAAIRLKEQPGAHITVLSMGPPSADNVVKECLALGADQGILLCDPAFAGADAYATAFTLAKAIEKIGRPDVIICGMASSDGATEWVGPEIATYLRIPVVTMVKKIVEIDDGHWTVKADIENGYRLVKVVMPAVFTVVRELNTPKTLSFSGIIKARKKEITQWDLGDLGLPAELVGLKGSPTIVSDISTKEIKREVAMIPGTIEEKANYLVRKLAAAGVLP